MLKCNLKKNVSGSNGTLISYTDLPLNIVYTLKYTNNDAPAINTILPHFYSLDFKNRYVSANINMESSKIIPLKLIFLGEMHQIWNSQLSYYVNTGGFYLQILQTRFQCFIVSV